MKLKQGTEAEYATYKEKNSTDGYSARVVSYGEDWANLMEAELAKGRTLAECAEGCGRASDTDGITGYMYGCAVSALAHFWENGEELRRWHNLDAQLGNEGEAANESGGTLNPAILNIGVRK